MEDTVYFVSVDENLCRIRVLSTLERREERPSFRRDGRWGRFIFCTEEVGMHQPALSELPAFLPFSNVKVPLSSVIFEYTLLSIALTSIHDCRTSINPAKNRFSQIRKHKQQRSHLPKDFQTGAATATPRPCSPPRSGFICSLQAHHRNHGDTA